MAEVGDSVMLPGLLRKACAFGLVVGGFGLLATETAYAQGVCLQKPVNCRISSPFGYRQDPEGKAFTEMHRGIDFACPTGTPVGAIAPGNVVTSSTSASAGNWVVKRIPGGYTTKYMHHTRNAVREGEQVAQGAVVGYVGSTGRSTGPHLHLQIENAQGIPVDPQAMWCDGPGATPPNILDGNAPIEQATDHDLNLSRGAAPSNPPAAPVGLDQGVLAIAADVVASRAFNPDYPAQLATLDNARLIGELAYLEGLSLRIRQERLRSRERREANEAALLSLRTEALRRKAEEARARAVAASR